MKKTALVDKRFIDQAMNGAKESFHEFISSNPKLQDINSAAIDQMWYESHYPALVKVFEKLMGTSGFPMDEAYNAGKELTADFLRAGGNGDEAAKLFREIYEEGIAKNKFKAENPTPSTAEELLKKPMHPDVKDIKASYKKHIFGRNK